MTLLFIDGFDHYYDPVDKYESIYGGLSYEHTSTVLPRTGTRHLELEGSIVSRVSKVYPDKTTIIIGFGLALEVTLTYTGDNWYQVVSIIHNDIHQLWLEYNPSVLHFRIRNGSFTSAETGIVDLSKGYKYIELKVTHNDTTGSYVFRINESIELSGNNINTDPAASTKSNKFRLYGQGALTNWNDVYIDDLYLCDNLGATNNDFLGSIEVHTLYPDADGNQNDFTPLGGGANYVEVDETPVDDNTSYVYSGTNGHLDLYDVDTLSGLDTILGVQVNTIATKTEAAVATMQLGIRSGGANDWGSINHDLGQNVYANYEEIWEQDPNGPINWTTGNLNNAEFGFKITV